ncbi:hypothetical protein [Fluviicola sp.]|uniref:TRAFAC clade GTPase domain-containing protein n=1 Tax=Fluviicola sp. TaxID=1917219 RepID=UPI0031E42580
MALNEENTILIIGGPNSGKTHFGGQLYGRLNTRSNHFKMISQPEDITIFKEVWDKLNEGKSAGHTHVDMHKTLELQIEDENGIKSTFTFPDYGGEQIKSIVNDRRLNQIWKEQIEKSNSWLLFIRLHEIVLIEDIVNRGIPNQEILQLRNSDKNPMKLSDIAFYIELLQILIFAKQVSKKSLVNTPKLSVVISCWDLLTKKEQKELPREILAKKLPGLYDFIQTTWEKNAFQVIGLSSTEKSLSNETPDMDFIKKGPENFGYIINNIGEKKNDLTLTIASFVENK